MRTYRIAVIGFGNVGQGLAQILRDRGAEFAQRFGLNVQIVAVCDMLKGSLYNPDGLDPAALLEAMHHDGQLNAAEAPYHGWDALRTIAETNANVVAEVTYTNLKTGEPATTHLRQALGKGKHVITTNKGPVALYYPELQELARANQAEIGVEGTVMSGTPAVRLGADLLIGAGIHRLQGVLNGTTNFILTRMENGATYAAALAEAQTRGYAEADPTGDVEGYDSAGKVVILANLLMGAALTMQDVDRHGITRLTSDDVTAARVNDQRWKLVGTVEQHGGHITASVKPVRLSLAHPLASANGVTNAITYTTDLLGDVTISGPGAGRLETGYALICDLLAIGRKAA